jgi:hypothetical protein
MDAECTETSEDDARMFLLRSVGYGVPAAKNRRMRFTGAEALTRSNFPLIGREFCWTEALLSVRLRDCGGREVVQKHAKERWQE